MKQIIAMGGGGFSMEPDNLLLDHYILNQSLKPNPKICFVSTASGDQDGYIQRFYHAFHSMACKPDHLALFDPHFKDIEDFVMSQDILYVGGEVPGICLFYGKNGDSIFYLKEHIKTARSLQGLVLERIAGLKRD